MADSRYAATALILAGGMSSRLGFDKQHLRHHGEFLLDIQLKTLRSLFDEIVIVSNTPECHQGRADRVVRDIRTGCGPLGGLHAGLTAATHDVCYLTACDMPWLNVPFIRFLMESQRACPECEAVVTEIGDMLEPMNGLYAKRLVPRIEGLLDSGKRRMKCLTDSASTVYVTERAARRYSPDWRMFDNINTPSDLARFQEQTEGDLPDDQKDPYHASGS